MTQTLPRDFRFATYEEAKKWFDTIDPLDEYGFSRRIGKESIPDEIARLELNLAFYTEFMNNRSRFPQWVHAQRAEEFMRLRKLRSQ